MKIELTNVSKEYHDLKIFENLNLVIESSKITCLYGFSGCGKTTLLNMIGFVESYKGSILYDGKEISKKKDVNKMLQNNVGFIFQEFGLIENESVLNNLKLVKKIKNMPRLEIEKTLSQLNLDGLIDKKVYKLSGGEKQRVAISKVMLKDVDLVLADEPTGSIDANNSEIVISLLKEMRDSGKTIIVSSHDDRIKEISDIAIDISSLRV